MKTSLTAEQLPNPFTETDNARDLLEDVYMRVIKLEETNRLFMECITTLMEAYNKQK